MADSSKSLKIGVIAEEKNDVEVLYELTCKIINEREFSFKQFVGHGCGKLRRKCGAWAVNLLRRGCTHLVVVHDLDKRNESELRAELDSAIKDTEFTRSLVLIPIEEIEAWLLADAKALKNTFKMRKQPKVPAKPETVADPKEHLADLVARHSKTKFLNTVHNKKIANAVGLSALKRCPSFAAYPPFIKPPKK